MQSETHYQHLAARGVLLTLTGNLHRSHSPRLVYIPRLQQYAVELVSPLLLLQNLDHQSLVLPPTAAKLLPGPQQHVA